MKYVMYCSRYRRLKLGIIITRVAHSNISQEMIFLLKQLLFHHCPVNKYSICTRIVVYMGGAYLGQDAALQKTIRFPSSDQLAVNSLMNGSND